MDISTSLFAALETTASVVPFGERMIVGFSAAHRFKLRRAAKNIRTRGRHMVADYKPK
jgi:hypothetical protein